jgi:hypothetical protein
MKIDKIAINPELLKISLQDKDIIEAYGEPIEFYIKNYVGIDTYFDFYKSRSDKDEEKLMEILRKLILNEHGQPAIKEDQYLPIDIILHSMDQIGTELGKLRTKLSIQKVGTPQEC